jgi:assimilatory nitrate reductase catalytic subunit
MLSHRELPMNHKGYWNRSLAAGDIWRYELACKTAPDDWAGYARQLLCTTDEDVNWIEYLDTSSGRYRAARLVDGQLESCIFIGPDHELPPRDWLIGLFDQQPLEELSRRSLLSGKPGAGQKDAGAVVCSCFGVGINTIVEAIRTQGLVTPEAIGEVLQAGTNCGSCVPELKSIIAANQPV